MEYALLVRWLVLYAALGMAGAVVAARLLPVPGRGVGFALPVALVLLGLPAYWVGHLSVFAGLAVGVGVLLAAAAVAGLDQDALRDGRLEAAAGLDLDRRAAVGPAVVFVVAFLFLAAVRAVDPGVFPLGGEKFLDFGLLKSLSRTAALPPEDMWFAGEPVRYYYGGHLLTYLLAELSATPIRYAYNLSLAGFYAMLVAAAYDLAGAVAAARSGSSRRDPVAGVLGAFFVGFAGNLHTARNVLVDVLPAGPRATLVSWFVGPDGSSDELLRQSSRFFYFDASRVIPGTINEFPLFAWLNGDLHAHMMGQPFVLLAAALAFAYYLTPAAERRRRQVLVFGAVPALAGLQAVVDTWSFPTVFGLLWLGVLFAPAHPLSVLPGGDRLQRLVDGREAVTDEGGVGSGNDGATEPTTRLRRELGRVGGALVVAGVAGVAGVVLALPFVLLAYGGGGGRSLEILAAAERSSLARLFLVHGAFVAAFVVFLLSRLERPVPVLVGAAALTLVAVTQGIPVVALTGPLLVVGYVALRFGTERPVGYETVLVVAGAGLVTMVEVVYLAEQAGPLRMNTVFKFYAQTWALWAVAAGATLSGLRSLPTPTASRTIAGISADGGSDTPRSAAAETGVSVDARQIVATAFVALLVVSTGLYGAFALDNHFGGSPEPTLDATAFVEQRHPEEAPAIRWVDDREGQPTLLSAPGTTWHSRGGTDERDRGMYAWTSNPASSLTGVPTVAGWQHEVGYRGAEAYYGRVRDVDTMFLGSTAEQSRLLRAYDVRYVWVGPAERLRYDSMTIDDHEALSVAFQEGSVTVYRVDQSALASE